MSQPVQAIEFYNKTRNILSLTCHDGESVSVGGKGKIIIPLSQAGHETISRAMSRGDLVRSRMLWVMDGCEVPEPQSQAQQSAPAPAPTKAAPSEEDESEHS